MSWPAGGDRDRGGPTVATTRYGTARLAIPLAEVAAVAPAVAIINNGPSKGGEAEVYARLRHAPGPPDIFQVHRNVETTSADNAPAANVANDEKACEGLPVDVSVDTRGHHYMVEVVGKGTRRAYSVRQRESQWYDHGL